MIHEEDMRNREAEDMRNREAENRYLEWNDKLRTQLAEKTQQNLDMQRKLTQQDKLIQTFNDMFNAQVDLQVAITKAIQMYDHYERTK